MTPLKFVWVEVDLCGDPVRIFKNYKASLRLPEYLVQRWPKGLAIRTIRSAIYKRSWDEGGQAHCEKCGVGVTEDSGEMHEKNPRGKGGEISLENSVFICQNCHRKAHGNRRWHSARVKEE